METKSKYETEDIQTIKVVLDRTAPHSHHLKTEKAIFNAALVLKNACVALNRDNKIDGPLDLARVIDVEIGLSSTELTVQWLTGPKKGEHDYHIELCSIAKNPEKELRRLIGSKDPLTKLRRGK